MHRLSDLRSFADEAHVHGAKGGFGPNIHARLVDPELDRQIEENGYATIQVMPVDRALGLARTLSALFPNGATPNQPNSNWYLGLVDPDRDLAVASARVVWDGVVQDLEHLFAESRCHYASVAIKPSDAGPTPMHQHWPSSTDPFARRIGCWVLLSEAKGSGGTFRLVPRSHQLLPFIRHKGSADYFDCFSQRIDEHYARNVALQPGEAVLFEDSIIHGTGGNVDGPMRIAAIASFIGTDMTTGAALPDGQEAFSIIETAPRDEMANFLRTGGSHNLPRRVATLPNRNREITEFEFIQLLALGRKATLEFDPLDLVRVEATRAGRGRQGLGWPRLRDSVRALARRIRPDA